MEILPEDKAASPVKRIERENRSPLPNPLRSGKVQFVAQSRRQYVIVEIRKVQIVRILHQCALAITDLVLEVVGVARVLLDAGSCNTEKKHSDVAR